MKKQIINQIILSLITISFIPNLLGNYDIHTGVDLKLMGEPSTGLLEPQNDWAKKIIKSIKTHDHLNFRKLLNEATAIRFCTQLFSLNKLNNFLFKHKLGNKKTIMDIANEANNSQIIRDLNILKTIYQNHNELGNLLADIEVSN